MKRHLLAITVFIAYFLFPLSSILAQKVNGYQSQWHPGLNIGQDEESLINQMQLDEKSQFLFLISNDEKNLYIDLVVADKAALQKILRYGLTTWINPEAKQKKTLGIEFPETSEGKEMPPAFNQNKNGDRKEMRKAMLASKNQEMTLIGFEGKKDRKVIDPKIDPSFDGNVEMLEGGRLRISLVIELAKLQRADMASMANPLSIGFETGYMDVTGSGAPSGGGQSMGGGPGGGGMYGGSPGGGPPPGAGAQGGSMGGGGMDQQQRPDISQLASPSRLWIKQVILSTK